MIAVIIAGGSGSRLWPLSTSNYPKHLLKLTNEKSLLQNTYGRAKLVSNKIYIISEASHAEHIFKQLPDLPKNNVIVEPGRRGTASCFIAALQRIKADNNNAQEAIVFMHADHHIRDSEAFKETVKRAGNFSVKYQKIVLLGGEPTYPATGFGYIQRGENVNGGKPIYDVISFKEKPDHKTAEKYLENGRYLWNMGYFVAPLSVFEASIKKFAPKLWKNYKKLTSLKNPKDFSKKYLSFRSEAIDTALIEHVKNLLVTPGTFDWRDVGSFPDIHLVNAQDDNGNTVRGKVEVESVTNSLVLNDTPTPVAVIGLDNVAVICTPDGILVTSKGHAQKVGDVSKKFLD